MIPQGLRKLELLLVKLLIHHNVSTAQWRKGRKPNYFSLLFFFPLLRFVPWARGKWHRWLHHHKMDMGHHFWSVFCGRASAQPRILRMIDKWCVCALTLRSFFYPFGSEEPRKRKKLSKTSFAAADLRRGKNEIKEEYWPWKYTPRHF